MGAVEARAVVGPGVEHVTMAGLDEEVRVGDSCMQPLKRRICMMRKVQARQLRVVEGVSVEGVEAVPVRPFHHPSSQPASQQSALSAPKRGWSILNSKGYRQVAWGRKEHWSIGASQIDRLEPFQAFQGTYPWFE